MVRVERNPTDTHTMTATIRRAEQKKTFSLLTNIQARP